MIYIATAVFKSVSYERERESTNLEMSYQRERRSKSKGKHAYKEKNHQAFSGISRKMENIFQCIM
jgi:hypothetical protein